VDNRLSLRISKLLLILTICLPLSGATVHSQTATTPARALEPGPKPQDVSPEWKQLVGIYGRGKESSAIILERNQKLFWVADGQESAIFPDSKNKNEFLLSDHREFRLETDPSGIVRQITLSGGRVHLPRSDGGSDSAHFLHVTLAKSIEELRTEALQPLPPEEPGPFRKPELVELKALDPSIHLDIRYAQSNNFLSTPVYSEARAFMQRPAAEALVRALHKLQPLGYGLLIHDAYRPWYVTKMFWDATPPADHIFVADPQKGSKHNRGCAVDLTLYNLATGQPVEMPGLYDEMSPRSFPNFPGGTSLQRWQRDLLRRVMESERFTVNENEWWHFDYKDWKRYAILNVPFEKLGQG